MTFTFTFAFALAFTECRSAGAGDSSLGASCAGVNLRLNLVAPCSGSGAPLPLLDASPFGRNVGPFEAARLGAARLGAAWLEADASDSGERTIRAVSVSLRARLANRVSSNGGESEIVCRWNVGRLRVPQIRQQERLAAYFPWPLYMKCSS